MRDNAEGRQKESGRERVNRKGCEDEDEKDQFLFLVDQGRGNKRGTERKQGRMRNRCSVGTYFGWSGEDSCVV